MPFQLKKNIFQCKFQMHLIFFLEYYRLKFLSVFLIYTEKHIFFRQNRDRLPYFKTKGNGDKAPIPRKLQKVGPRPILL